MPLEEVKYFITRIRKGELILKHLNDGTNYQSKAPSNGFIFYSQLINRKFFIPEKALNAARKSSETIEF